MSADTVAILLRKLESVAALDDADRRIVSALPFRERRVEAGHEIASEGEEMHQCCLVVSGVLHRHKVFADGRRQILSLHTPGEIPDLMSLMLPRMDHTLGALTASTVAFVPHASVRASLRQSPAVAEALWRETLIDAAIMRIWMVGLGRKSAYAQFAHLLCELFTRMSAVGLASADACELPLTQGIIGDALGLSTVHVNRTLQQLRADGLIRLQLGRLTILDWERLVAAGEFDPAYLRLRHPPNAAPRPDRAFAAGS